MKGEVGWMFRWIYQAVFGVDIYIATNGDKYSDKTCTKWSKVPIYFKSLKLSIRILK